jgi:hypothetical protein
VRARPRRRGRYDGDMTDHADRIEKLSERITAAKEFL